MIHSLETDYIQAAAVVWYECRSLKKIMFVPGTNTHLLLYRKKELKKKKNVRAKRKKKKKLLQSKNKILGKQRNPLVK